MATKRIPVTSELSDYVESLMYECEARKDLCAFMVDRGMAETPQFEKYHDAYIKAAAEYAVAKGELTRMAGQGKTWRMDFEKRELVVENAE